MTTQSVSPLTLPVVTIQPTFPEVIQEVLDGIVPSDKFWVSCYKTPEPSVHAKVHAGLDEIDRNRVNLSAEGDVEVLKTFNSTYTVACKSLGIPPTRIISPVQEYKDRERSNLARPHRITAFDISPDSSRFATGFLDGSVYLYPTSTVELAHPTSLIPQSIDITNSKTSSRPHLSGVVSLKFFPSSRVLLSSGQDFSLSILPADLFHGPSGPGTHITPVSTMRAHTRTVTDSAIISIGRNILSSSLDCTLKLWDVSSAAVISSLTSLSPIVSMSLGDRMPIPPDGEEFIPPVAEDSREKPETASKLVFCGLENGSFELFDLGVKKSTYSYSHNLLATGSSSGIITVYDTRSLRNPLTSFNRLETVIEDLAFIFNTSRVCLAIATADGLPYIASVAPEGPAVNAELVGADCDPVRNIGLRDNDGRREVWSASDDGIVRRYIYV